MQVFPAGTTNTTVDPALLTDLPPALCKKGGATFRIKCLDDGSCGGSGCVGRGLTVSLSALGRVQVS